MRYTIRFDGLFRGVPSNQSPGCKAGFMCYGWLILRDHHVIATGYGGVARGVNATSNIAEYLALIEGLEAYLDAKLQDESVIVCGDAKCIVEQMQGFSAVNANNIKPLYSKAQRLAAQIHEIAWLWTPRKHNRAADLLTRKAMRQIRQDRHQYEATTKAINPYSDDWRRSKKLLPLFDLRIYFSPAG
jgi:ribonuclease HI